jgi:GT2 family glycosyltransferase
LKLSVIILNYNVRYFLELCLKSLIEAVKAIDAEIIVVDNNSNDDSCEMVKQLFPNVVLIENKENFGFSKGNNIGIKIAKGEYLCILNPDTMVAEDTFTKLLEFADSKANLGILGCKLINGRGQFLPESKRNIPTPWVSLKKMLGNATSYYSSLKPERIGEVDVLVGAFMLLKAKVYNEVDGFDEDYFMYGEDIDLSYKILKKGYTNYYNGEVSVLHFKGESTLKDNNYAKRFYGAMQIFYKKHFKQNFIFNSMVFLGIKVAFLTRKSNKTNTQIQTQSQVFSNRNLETLKAQLPQQVEICTDLSKIKDNSLVLLDSEILSYKTILQTMRVNGKNKNVAFRILPKSSKFSIGSDSTITRGEVIKFD